MACTLICCIVAILLCFVHDCFLRTSSLHACFLCLIPPRLFPTRLLFSFVSCTIVNLSCILKTSSLHACFLCLFPARLLFCFVSCLLVVCMLICCALVSCKWALFLHAFSLYASSIHESLILPMFPACLIPARLIPSHFFLISFSCTEAGVLDEPDSAKPAAAE